MDPSHKVFCFILILNQRGKKIITTFQSIVVLFKLLLEIHDSMCALLLLFPSI